MEPIMIARLMSWRAAGISDAWSALPDAPQVVQPQRRPLLAPTRAALAGMLVRLACALEPAPTKPA